MKKILITACVLALTLLPALAHAQEYVDANPNENTDYIWSCTINNDGTATITGVTPHATGAFIVPGKVTNLSTGVTITVTAITNGTNGSFSSNGIALSHITSLTLPPTLTSIGDFAFDFCSSLKCELTIPDNVTYIGNCAFNNCTSLYGNLNLGNLKGLATIGYSCFGGCFNLNGELTLPPNITSIESYAFYGCAFKNNNLFIPSKVTAIEPYAFYNCQLLTGGIVVPKGVKIITNETFRSCKNLNSITYESTSLDFAGTQTFSDCSSLTKVDISASTSTTGLVSLSRNSTSSVFNGLPSSTKVYMPQDLQPKITSIPGYSPVDDVNYIWATADGIEGVNANKSDVPMSLYTIGGQYVGNNTNILPKGVYIVNGKKVMK